MVVWKPIGFLYGFSKYPFAPIIVQHTGEYACLCIHKTHLIYLNKKQLWSRLHMVESPQQVLFFMLPRLWHQNEWGKGNSLGQSA